LRQLKSENAKMLISPWFRGDSVGLMASSTFPAGDFKTRHVDNEENMDSVTEGGTAKAESS
jgi:hypothetical protein